MITNWLNTFNIFEQAAQKFTLFEGVYSQIGPPTEMEMVSCDGVRTLRAIWRFEIDTWGAHPDLHKCRDYQLTETLVNKSFGLMRVQGVYEGDLPSTFDYRDPYVDLGEWARLLMLDWKTCPLLPMPVRVHKSLVGSWGGIG